MEKREYILTVALELFGQKGFEGTSVRDIACKANVNVAMISYYFGSKEKMFQSIVEHKASHLKDVFRELIKNEFNDVTDDEMKLVDSKYDDRAKALQAKAWSLAELAKA